MAHVSLRNVNKIYRSGGREIHAVENLNLEIKDGEFIALLGPSGCGKTSTLRMIVGLEPITSGDILFDNVRVNDLDPQQRNVAMAFETYALYPNFTVEQNLAFPLEVRGIAKEMRNKKTREVAEMLRLTSVLAEKPSSLSGGQQQRVSLGRALIREPAVFILDEVMSHLDAHLKFQMLFDLKRLHRQLRRTMIFVTHDQVEALALADRVAVMSNARLQQVGSRNELYNSPVNVFVADFIGEPPTNFFQARRRSEGEKLFMQVDDADMCFEISDRRAQKLKRAKADIYIIGIRPQNMRLANGSGGVDAEVLINEYLGERSILTVKNGNVRFRALVPPDMSAKRGELIKLVSSPEDVMVFDAETQALIN
jgi:multiple sugar transport system ATP-binding protein